MIYPYSVQPYHIPLFARCQNSWTKQGPINRKFYLPHQ